MQDTILHIANAILFDEDKPLHGDREVRSVEIDEVDGRTVAKVTIAVEKANPAEARFAIEDDMRSAIVAQFPEVEARILTLAIDGEDEPQAACGHGAHGANKALEPKKRIPGVGHVYLVCSAKGGVGKSTVALNTALALQKAGKRVALLDLDLYGPSIPALVGSDLPPIVVGNLIMPPQIHGLSVLSIGFMIENDQPLMWRGPMVSGVINQLLWEVDWSGHDALVIDMPPGTGDTYLSILQTVEIDSAVIVTTPSQLALADVKRGIGVFSPYGVPIAGVVENMATYDWDGREGVLKLLDQVPVAADDDATKKTIDRIRKILDTTKSIRIFGNRTKEMCQKLGLELITSIPLDIALQNDNDAGTPYMLNPKKAAIQASFDAIADFLIRRENATIKSSHEDS